MTNKAKAGSTKKPTRPRAETKRQIILSLLTRPGGATLSELTKATKWQPHSVRGFLSGTLCKRMGMPLQSTKDGKGDRRYSIESYQRP